VSQIQGVERRVLLKSYGKWAWVLRTQPAHAAHWILGIELPPHERNWLRLYFSTYKENNVVASRGTSKSFTHSSLAAPLKAMLRKNRMILSVSAAGFRGGKLLMDDSERMLRGQLKSQYLPGPFAETSISHKSIIKRDVDRWTMPFRSHSYVMTIPTNNADNMLGVRANEAIVDERNTFPGVVVQKNIRPWMNVGADFKRTNTAGDANQIFQIGTIDYTIRDWYPELEVQRKLARREYDAQMALAVGDHKEYTRLMDLDSSALKTWSGSYTRVDYTDLIIPTQIDDEEGRTFRVQYPLPPDMKQEEVTRWDETDQQHLIYTYPTDKEGLEAPRLNGTMDAAIWKAEQRNCFIEAAGNVYNLDLIRKVALSPVYRQGQLSKFPNLEDFFAPILYTCGDPCVVGIDYARESDFFAIVVIRLGELAKGDFDPDMPLDRDGRARLGKTTWNSVIWAEAHQKWTAPEAGDRIREIYSRYNIVRKFTAGEWVRGMGMDKGGGGTAVRDELAQPRVNLLSNGEPDPDWEMPIRIFDPEDDSYAHFAAIDSSQQYWGGLELLKPTNQDNIDWTMTSRGLMQANKIYLGYFLPPSLWAAREGIVNPRGEPDRSHPLYTQWETGYNGVRRLREQLERLQRKVTDTGVTRFTMPGDRTKEEGKKDLYSAFIYACHMANQHLADSTRRAPRIPLAEPIAVQISRAGGGPGDSWYRTLGL
jgi:hypothetical protein